MHGIASWPTVWSILLVKGFLLYVPVGGGHAIESGRGAENQACSRVVPEREGVGGALHVDEGRLDGWLTTVSVT